MPRVFLTVIDSFGIGAAPDAAKFGDAGSDTCGHIADAVDGFALPNLEKIGLGLVKNHPKIAKKVRHNVTVAALQEHSNAKDTVAGHHEMMGVVSDTPFPTFPQGFPLSFMNEWVKASGRGFLCNKPYSGTKVLDDFAEEHLRTGKLIIYTSSDSVFQIAAHEQVVPIEKLYELCHLARRMLDPLRVCRIIARPFNGTPGKWVRLNNKRHDYTMKPLRRILLEDMQTAGIKVIAVGKIFDIFAGVGINKSIHTDGNTDGMIKMLQLVKTAPDNSFIFTNLVDFDSVYGHRRNPVGYYKALREFDRFLVKFIPSMRQDDTLMIIADHGCDPTFKGSDHTRELVPFLCYSPNMQTVVDCGVQQGFVTAGATVMACFGAVSPKGTSIIPIQPTRSRL